MSRDEKICKVIGFILIGIVGVLFAPLWILLSPVIAFAWWIDGAIKRDRLAAAKKAMREAQAFDPEPIHQSAHFATDAELEAAHCFDGFGTILGFSQESGRAISTPQSVHRIIFGSTGSGKSTNAIMMAILTIGDDE